MENYLLFFKTSRALRQCDILSPEFFIVMRILNKMFLRDREIDMFRGLKRGRERAHEVVTCFLLMTFLYFLSWMKGFAQS